MTVPRGPEGQTHEQVGVLRAARVVGRVGVRALTVLLAVLSASDAKANAPLLPPTNDELRP